MRHFTIMGVTISRKFMLLTACTLLLLFLFIKIAFYVLHYTFDKFSSHAQSRLIFTDTSLNSFNIVSDCILWSYFYLCDQKLSLVLFGIFYLFFFFFQFIFDRLTSVFTHKVWRVREGVCTLLTATINRFGARSLVLSKIVPHVCKLLSDPNGQVFQTSCFGGSFI